jgi:two-component system sensor histidine kinase UhpB
MITEILALLTLGLAVTTVWLGWQHRRLIQWLRVTRLESHRHEAVIDNVPDAIISVDEEQRIVLFNPAAQQLFGCDLGNALGKKLHEFVDTSFWSAATPAIAWSESIPASTFMAREVRAMHRLGHAIEAEASMSQSTQAGLTTVVLRDVAVRKRAEQRLRETQASLMDALRLARLGHFAYDIALESWTLAPSLLEVLGDTKAGPGKHSSLFEDVHPEDLPSLKNSLTPESLKQHFGLNIEFRAYRRDSQAVRWLHALGRPRQDANGQTRQLVGSMQDITERKLATLALEQSQEELHRLSANLTRAREDERRHVARDLHDELGQRLSALKLDLFTAMAHPEVRATGLDKRLQPLIQSVNNAVSETRRIASNLRPAMLDDLGLHAAIEWLAHDFTKRFGIPVDLACMPGDQDLNDIAITTIYRIVQEALTNMSRHAHAQSGRIELFQQNEHMVIRVEDDGQGLSPSDTEKAGSFGLAGIRERARILGGISHMTNRPEGGCRLEVRLPWERVIQRTAQNLTTDLSLQPDITDKH